MGSLGDILNGASLVALDTMVFIYHMEDRRPYSDLTTEIFKRGEEGLARLNTSVITITEVLTGYRRVKNQTAEWTFIRMLEDFSSFLNVTPVDFLIADRAASLRAAYGLRTPDAIQLASAFITGSRAYITNDRGLEVIKEIPILILDDFITSKRK